MATPVAESGLRAGLAAPTRARLLRGHRGHLLFRRRGHHVRDARPHLSRLHLGRRARVGLLRLHGVAAHRRTGHVLLLDTPRDASPPALQARSPGPPPIAQPVAVRGLRVRSGGGRGPRGVRAARAPRLAGARRRRFPVSDVHDPPQRTRAPGDRALSARVHQEPSRAVEYHDDPPRPPPSPRRHELRPLLHLLGQADGDHDPGYEAAFTEVASRTR